MRRPRALIVPLLAILAFAPGCYERVVSARGPGADQMKIEKANLPPEKSDKVLGYKRIDMKRLPGE